MSDETIVSAGTAGLILVSDSMDVRLIDANALIEAICKKCPEYDFKPDATDTVSGCLTYDVIASAPTIEAQPVKHGHWIKKDIFYVCSECGIELIDDWFEQIAIFQDGYMPFCPNCGAKMCGGDADEIT